MTNRRPIALSTLALVTASVALLHCGPSGGSSGGTGGPSGPSAEPIPTKPGTNDSGLTVGDYPAHATLGAQGGTVKLPDGPTLEIPVGALPEKTGFGLGPAATQPELPQGTVAASAWFDLVSDKNDLSVLAKPLVLSIPIKLPSGASAKHPGLRVLGVAGSGVLLPIEGTFDPASGAFRVVLPGLPPKLTFVVGFTASVVTMTSAEVPEDPVPAGPTPPGAGWGTVQWVLDYDGKVVSKTQALKVLFFARRAARAYSDAGFLEPSLTQRDDGTTKRWVIHLTSRGSYFHGGNPSNVGDAALGRLYVSVDRIDTPITHELGSVHASIAHEMLHAVFAAHRIPSLCFNYTENGVVYCYPSNTGLDEGMATAVGYHLDQGSPKPRPSEPPQPLSTPFGAFSSTDQGRAYQNQDFFVHQLRAVGLPAFAKQMKALASTAIAGAANDFDCLARYHAALEASNDGWPDGLRAAFLQYVYDRGYARAKGPLRKEEPLAAKAAKYSLDDGLFAASAITKVEQRHCKVVADGVRCEVEATGIPLGARRFDIDMKTGGATLPPGYAPTEMEGTFTLQAEGASADFFVVGQKQGVGSAESVAASTKGGAQTLSGLNATYDEVRVVALPFGKDTTKLTLTIEVKPKALGSACAEASKWMCTCQPGGAQPCWIWDMAVQQGCSNAGGDCEAWCAETAASYADASKDPEMWEAMGCTAGP